ncbi:MAG TPA: SCO family protein [Pirellulales bacterium]|nr:SCO family protein [Pirellulales bacterium]
MTSPAVKAWLSFLLVALALYGSFTIRKVYRANAAAARHDEPHKSSSFVETLDSKPLVETLDPVPLKEFTFVDSEGEPFSMEQLAGKVWVASYFFATCPGFCLQMNQEIAKVVRDLAGEDVTFVSFTVDPENDTPEELQKYAERMRADPRRWVFLTGDGERIRQLGQQYLKMPATKEHNDKLVVVDRNARIGRDSFYSSRDSFQLDRLKAKIERCLAEKADAESAAAESADAGSEVQP